MRDESPWSYRKQDIWDDLKSLRGIGESWEGLRAIGKGRIPDLKHYETTRKGIGYRYKTRIYVEGINKVTGEAVERYPIVGHNELVSIEELEKAAQEALEEAKSPIKISKMYAIEAYADPRPDLYV